MPRLTIKSLQDQLQQVTDSYHAGCKHEQWQTGELNRLRDQVKALEADKRWLQSIISPLAQAIHTRS